MRRTCRFVVVIYALLWLAAVAVLAIGTFGLLGQERDPLAAVFLIPLGLPWSLMLGDLPGARAPIAAMILAPFLNITILALLCRKAGRRN